MSYSYNAYKIAFFDLDGTITEKSENAGIKLEEVLYEKGILKKEDWWLTLEVIGKYRRNEISYERLIQNLSRIYANALKGVPVCEVQNVLSEVVKRIKLREEVPEVIQWFKDNGFILVLMSASPIEVVRVIASKLHFDEAYGLKLETIDGVYAGKFFTVTSKYKRNLIKRKLKEHRFSVGVGDNLCDMEAYQDLDIRFLINDDYLANERFVNAKTKVIKNLKEMLTFLTHSLLFEFAIATGVYNSSQVSTFQSTTPS